MSVGRRRAPSERGAAAVEFALVVPLLLLLIFGIISYGMMLSFRQGLTQAASEGARAAAVTLVEANRKTEIEEALKLADELKVKLILSGAIDAWKVADELKKRDVPVILATVNNQWAISSFSGIAGAERATFAQRAVGYGVAGLRVDGNDALAVFAAVRWAADRARSNQGPTLIEFFTYRAEGHSTSDDPSGYRPTDEAKAWPLGDPIERLKGHLVALGEWDEQRHEELSKEADANVRAAQKESEKLGILPQQGKDNIGSMFEDVYADVPWHIAEQRDLALDENR